MFEAPRSPIFLRFISAFQSISWHCHGFVYVVCHQHTSSSQPGIHKTYQMPFHCTVCLTWEFRNYVYIILYDTPNRKGEVKSLQFQSFKFNQPNQPFRTANLGTQHKETIISYIYIYIILCGIQKVPWLMFPPQICWMNSNQFHPSFLDSRKHHVKATFVLNF